MIIKFQTCESFHKKKRKRKTPTEWIFCHVLHSICGPVPHPSFTFTHTRTNAPTLSHTHMHTDFSVKKKKKMALCYPSMSCTLLNCFPQILNIRSICGTNENVYWFLVQEVGEIPKISVNSFSVLKIACMSNTSLNAQSMCSCSYPTPTIVLILSLLFSGK